jgi:hypothetical protein
MHRRIFTLSRSKVKSIFLMVIARKGLECLPMELPQLGFRNRLPLRNKPDWKLWQLFTSAPVADLVESRLPRNQVRLTNLNLYQQYFFDGFGLTFPFKEWPKRYLEAREYFLKHLRKEKINLADHADRWEMILDTLDLKNPRHQIIVFKALVWRIIDYSKADRSLNSGDEPHAKRQKLSDADQRQTEACPPRLRHEVSVLCCFDYVLMIAGRMIYHEWRILFTITRHKKVSAMTSCL